ncbi:MAG TPA: UDP-N-acetylglucosamine 2-epimerase (non-hydrolyzing) [Pirellulales bacterium]|jgi:UDP-N-acetylglucosamine 2-epimerase (non-hydrolysing)|nr:UDP-N-acetylglucosamine 2-epimerase (non-hydrolyzing) [Pirellulales bacterium]
MPRLRIFLTFGARPEAIKMAPVVRACLRRPEAIEPIVCTTGQHRELLSQVIDYFEIRPDVDLAVMRHDQSLAALTARCLSGLDETLARHKPDCVVAQGDTTTVLAAALAAFYRRIPFVHVEAGLRTGNLQSPWPEELNRRAASLATSLHFAPTRRAEAQLLSEGVASENVFVTGNTVIDALLWTVERERGKHDQWRQKHAALADRRMVLVTGHRRESFGAGFEQICRGIAALADRFADVEFLYPVHLNPHVRESVHRLLGGRGNVRLIEPVAYPEFIWLMDRSALILTDSGGVQEEAPSLRKPVLVMRDTTERPEAVEAGAAELVGADAERIVSRTSALLSNPTEYAAHQVAVNPYGDGRAAERIVDRILKHFRRRSASAATVEDE